MRSTMWSYIRGDRLSSYLNNLYLCSTFLSSLLWRLDETTVSSYYYLLNVLSRIIHLPFSELSIIIFGDIKMGIANSTKHEYADLPMALHWWPRVATFGSSRIRVIITSTEKHWNMFYAMSRTLETINGIMSRNDSFVNLSIMNENIHK